MKKIVILTSAVAPHVATLTKELILNQNCSVFIFYIKETFKHLPPTIENLETYNASKINLNEIKKLINSFNPDIIITSGWTYSKFNKACFYFKKRKIPIISIMDNQWHGNIKQRILTLISKITLKQFIDYIWAIGYYQFEYARRLGFDKNNIILYGYCSNNHLFNQINIHERFNGNYKNFVFIGRNAKVKGINNLINAWNKINNKKDWTLTLVGKGIENLKIEDKSIIIKSFLSQEELKFLLLQSGCFILPSIFEPWGVVIHEAASAGLPLILSNVCGATPHFLINNYNGFSIDPFKEEELEKAIYRIINLNKEELILMSERSRNLSKNIDIDITIANLFSIIEK